MFWFSTFIYIFVVLLGLICSVDSLSPAIEHTLDNCAHECAQQVLLELSCPDRSDECYCSSTTDGGLTVGEALVQCLLESCPGNVVSNQYDQIYGLCDVYPGSAPRTHSRLTVTREVGTTPTTFTLGNTAPVSTLTSSGESTGLGTVEPTTTPITDLPITFETPISRTGTGDAANSEQTATPGSSASSTSTSTSIPAADNNDSNDLSAGSVVGVSIASGVSGFFLIGIALFFWRRRMRRKNKNEGDSSSDFEIGGAMSEPPDFSSTPRRPTPGPQIPPKPIGSDSDGDGNRDQYQVENSSRLMSPFQPALRLPNPAVVVTRADDDYDYNGGRQNAEGLGDVIYPTPPLDYEEDSPNTHCSSSRTLSELLPDKPELYPEPLRVGQKMSTPKSAITTFEEDAARPQSHQYPSFSGLVGPRPYIAKRPMPGLPANPRAMLGFKSQDHLIPAKRSPDPSRMRSPELMRPVYLNPEQNVPHPLDAALRTQSSMSNRNECSDDDDDSRGPTSSPSRTAARPTNRFYTHSSRSAENLRTDFERTSPINEGPPISSPGINRHSGSFKPLSPVREVKTPSRNGSHSSSQAHKQSPPVQCQYPRIPPPFSTPPNLILATTPTAPVPSTSPTRTPPIPSTTPDPSRETVSRPRIVRQHDIKRVEIRRGKPQQPHQETPNSTPYSPDDFWKEPGQRGSASFSQDDTCVGSGGSGSVNGAAQTPGTPGASANRYSWAGGVGMRRSVEKTITRKPVSVNRRSVDMKRVSPLEHSLTPSRQGGDLILRVD